jgi:hypothetical protein
LKLRIIRIIGDYKLVYFGNGYLVPVPIRPYRGQHTGIRSLSLKERGRPGEEGNEGGFLILPVPLPLPFPDGQTSPSLPSLSRYYPLALGGKGSVRKGEWGGERERPKGKGEGMFPGSSQ